MRINNITAYNMRVQNYTNKSNQDKMYTNKSDSETNTYVSQPNFTGFMGIFKNLTRGEKLSSEQLFLNSDMAILSPKQIIKAKEYVVDEVFSLIKSPYTQPLSQRLDKLLNSPYADYSLSRLGEGRLSLSDYIEVLGGKSTAENKMYNQFLRTSLAKTLPSERLNGEMKRGIYERNHGIFQIFQNYTKMDEASKESQEVRDMILRLKECNVDIDDYPEFFADCLLSDKPQMCKFLQKELGLTPETKVHILRGDEREVNDFSKHYGATNIFDDPHWISRSNYRNEKKVLIVHPKRLAADNSYWDYLAKLDNKDTMSLYDIAGLSPHKSAKEVFDIPDYICKHYAGVTRRERGFMYTSNIVDLMYNFFFRNAGRHPELKSFEFIEQFAARLKEGKGGEISKYLRSVPDNLFISAENLEKTNVLIAKLKSDNTPENLKRLKALEELRDYIALGLMKNNL